MSEIASVLRPLGPFDLQLLAALHARCFSAAWDQAWSASSFAEILAMPGAMGWLISEDDEPRGFVLVRSVLDEMEIILIATDPDHRQRGFGHRLLAQVLETAQSLGVVSIFLEQAAPNTAARMLYRRNGFAEVGLRRGYYRGADDIPIDAVILRRSLVSA